MIFISNLHYFHFSIVILDTIIMKSLPCHIFAGVRGFCEVSDSRDAFYVEKKNKTK